MPVCSACATEVAADLRFCPRCGSVVGEDPLIGAVLGERYRIVSRIGAGGMGAVYRAEHTMMRRDFAVKVLLPELGGRDEFARRFEREAESASRLNHPNVITVTDFGRTSDGLLFLVMEFLGGHSLTALIRQGPLPVPRALAILRQILAGLDHAHAAGVVHRDLKPDNVMLVDRDGQGDFVKLLDFGIAKVTQPASGGEALTQAGVVFGTPEYLSPEQALGEVVDARADLYAAGVILFELLTGRRPYESDDKVRIISMHLSHPVPRLRDLNPAVSVPPPVEELVLQAMEKSRDNRFASARAFLAAIDDAEAAAAAGEVSSDAALAPTGLLAPVVRAANRDAGTGTPGPSPATAATVAGGAPSGASPSPPWGAPTVSPPSTPSSTAGPASGPASSTTTLATAGPAALWRRVSPRTRVGAMAALALIVIGAGAVAIWSSGHDRGLGSSRVPKPAPPSAALAGQIHRIESMLAAGDLVKARAAVEQALAEHPDSARVRYLLGRVAFADGRKSEALADYREAIALDVGYRGDAVVLEHLGAALAETKLADQALDLATERIGRPAADLLEHVANDPNADVRRRAKAAAGLEELGLGRRVDRVALDIASLKKAATCDEKKPLVVTLGKSADLRALQPLRAQRPRGGLSALFGTDADVRCMKTELAEAIEALEKLLPEPPPKPSPTTTKRSTSRRSSTRPSLFRGR